MRTYTGDDFNYAELIAGDGRQPQRCAARDLRSDRTGREAPPCSRRSPTGRTAAFHEILAPTVPLSRHIFKAPTRFYKTGVVFMAYLNGHQDHFVMVGGQESARSLVHLAELFRLADAAGLLRDPELAVARMRKVMAVRGVGGMSYSGSVPPGRRPPRWRRLVGRKADVLHQLEEARVGTEAVPRWRSQENHFGRALLVGLPQPRDRLVVVAQAHLTEGERNRVDLLSGRRSLQLAEYLPRLVGPPRQTQDPAAKPFQEVEVPSHGYRIVKHCERLFVTSHQGIV